MVCGFLPQAPLWLAVDANDCPLAFMLIDGGHMEALFVDPAHRGTGIGAALVRHGLTLHPKMTPDVNEQMIKLFASMNEWDSETQAARQSTDRVGRIHSSTWNI